METISTEVAMPAMVMVAFAIAILASIISLVGMIMLIVKIFAKSEGSEGIIAIVLAIFCTLGLYIWGWVKVGEWDAKKPLMIWTAGMVLAMVASMVIFGTGAMTGAAGSLENIQRQVEETEAAEIEVDPMSAE